MSINKTLQLTNYTVHPPLGEKPEPDINLEAALDKLGETIQSLLKNMNKLQKNLDKLTAENKRLKDALGITETLEPLVLTEDMEVKDGH
jgi:peptidoglycan hydrolase CwlO-like protein